MSTSDPLMRSSRDLVRHGIGPQYSETENSSDGNRFRRNNETAKESTWLFGIWGTPVQIISFVVFGIVAALGHLFYYRFLVGKPVDAPLRVSQEWNIRIGTGLAFVAKSSWTVAIITSQIQHVWRTVHTKKLPPKVIDAAFLAPTDITYLLRLDLLRHAVVVTLLAIAAWGIPISAIFTPATLTVTGHTSSRVVLGTVPAIDFDDYPRWALMNPIGYFPPCFNEYKQGRGNCTGRISIRPSEDKTPMMVWRTYSSQLGIHVMASTSSGRIEQMIPEFVNSTYLLKFNGPSIQCRNATERRKEFKALAGNEISEVRYAAFVPALNGTETFAYNMTKVENTAVRYAYGLELWIVTNAAVFGSADDYEVKEAHICTMYNSSYAINATFQDGQQRLNATVEPIEPVEWQAALELQNDKSDDDKNFIPIPVNTNVQRFAYQGIWGSLVEQLLTEESIQRTIVVGAKEFGGDFKAMDKYNGGGSNGGYGGGTQPFRHNKTLVELVEQVSQNITLSLLSNPAFLSSGGTSTDITVRENSNIYSFNQRVLLISYGIALAVTIAAAIVGLLAYRTNGGDRSFAYSALVEAFREDRVEMKPPKAPRKPV